MTLETEQCIQEMASYIKGLTDEVEALRLEQPKLRDYFAAAALTGLVSAGIDSDVAPLYAYAHADNMLRIRTETKEKS